MLPKVGGRSLQGIFDGKSGATTFGRAVAVSGVRQYLHEAGISQ